MFNYTEYKMFSTASAAGLEAAIVIHESGNGDLTLDTPLNIITATLDMCGFSDRTADIIGVKGFLGFLNMVESYPVEFKEDIDEWVRVYAIGKRFSDILLAGESEEVRNIVMSDPDVIYSLRFIINPRRFIKG